MNGKAFFIDTTLCTGCRGCQIACKQWNQLPATKTENWGSYQNPKDLSFYTYKLIRFSEHMGPDDKPVWYFFADQCRHCLAPPCQESAEATAPGGIIIDSLTGAVLYTDKLKKANPKEVREACPFDIPRAQKGTGYMAKCTMCVERVHNGLLPACVKTCPTGAMNFGPREKMLEKAEKRLQEVRRDAPKAMLADPDEVNVIYLVAYDPMLYHSDVIGAVHDTGISRQMALKRLMRPFTRAASRLSTG